LVTTPPQARTISTNSLPSSHIRPLFSIPTFSTKSISVAPSSTAWVASKTFTSVVVWPNGKPTAAQTPTPVPRNCAAQNATGAELMATVAKPLSLASRQSCANSASVAFARNNE
jgi:hypothetical protein